MIRGDKCRSWQTHARKFSGASSMSFVQKYSLSYQYEPANPYSNPWRVADSVDQDTSTRRGSNVSGILSKKRPQSLLSAADAAIVHAA